MCGGRFQGKRYDMQAIILSGEDRLQSWDKGEGGRRTIDGENQSNYPILNLKIPGFV